MSGYQRMVSYLYRYEKGIKGKNVGYARIELRNGKCRVTVRFQDTISASPGMSFFIQKEEGLIPVPAGKLARNGNTFAGRIETSQVHVAGTDYSFEQIDGIYITGSQNVFYATTWKDIVISEHGTDTDTEISEGSEHTEVEPAAPEGGKIGRKKEYVIPEQTEFGPEQTRLGPERTELEQGQTVPESEVPQMEASSVSAGGCDDRDAMPEGRQQNPKTRSREFCEKMLRVFPKMYPFETAGMGECVRIDLKDIGNLPVAYWSLAGNPFLLRGYYCYRHLIFTRMDGDSYGIGVPGIYSEDNGRWAEECRMTHFQPLSPVKDRQGAFGYWLYRIS